MLSLSDLPCILQRLLVRCKWHFEAILAVIISSIFMTTLPHLIACDILKEHFPHCFKRELHIPLQYARKVGRWWKISPRYSSFLTSHLLGWQMLWDANVLVVHSLHVGLFSCLAKTFYCL